MALPAGETAPRLRAARAYAKLEVEDIAALLDVSKRTYGRMEAGEREIDIDQLRLVAARCGVPPEFMEHGFPTAPPTPVDLLAQRVAALEAERQQMLAEMAKDLAQQVAARLGLEDEPSPGAGPARPTRRAAP